jgi:hypothetical protein
MGVSIGIIGVSIGCSEVEIDVSIGASMGVVVVSRW